MLSLSMLPLLTLIACPKPTDPETSVPTVVDPLAERPVVGEPSAFVPPTAESFTLDSGATVHVVEQRGLPLVSVRLLVDGGKTADPADQPGLTSIANQALTRGTTEHDANAFAELLDQQAIVLGTSTYGTMSMVYVDSHSARLDTALGLMAEAVLSPSFDADELEKLQGQIQAQIDEANARPTTVAYETAERLYWGEGHVMAHATSGTKESVGATTAAGCRESWSQRFRPENATFVITGDIDAHGARTVLDQTFGAWDGTATDTRAMAEAAPTPGYYLVDDPGSTQSTLRVVMPGWSASQPELVAARLGAIVLGGTFTSRLNRLLREEKGYTYGARASTSYGADWGQVVASTSVRSDVTGAALADLLGELDKITAGIDEAELEKAKGARRTSLTSSVETRSGTAGSFAWALADGYDNQYLASELTALDATTLAQVNAALASIDLDQAVVVVVGDLSTVTDQVSTSVPDVTWTTVE
ncbi:MAG: insulinase family protein [Proteobacteria bacterium]|nr:insulinase family protein [Pseudomonadota bacterium]